MRVIPLLLVLGAPIGALVLLSDSALIEEGLLAFTAGMLVLVVVEGLVPEAHQRSRRHASVAGALFLLGFTAFALVSTVFG